MRYLDLKIYYTDDSMELWEKKQNYFHKLNK